MKIKIQQDFTDRLTIKEKNNIVEAEGTDLNIENKHNNKVSWKSNVRWISEAPQSTNMNNSTITLRIATNEAKEQRKATITFTTPNVTKDKIKGATRPNLFMHRSCRRKYSVNTVSDNF